MKKSLFLIILSLILVYSILADDFANLLQDLAVQTACLGMYSTAQTGVYVNSRYDDPPDWYNPPMLANRFAEMSGNMTRTITFYGICFDYAQFAWDDINKYQKMYNDAGMKGQQWYIAATRPNDPYTIILYDPTTKEKATIIMNGVYLKENSRHNVSAHDMASGHAWIWIQHNDGTWYWIDPTWTDNTGYPWWGSVRDGMEVQYNPDPKYCVATNYPGARIANNYSIPDVKNNNTKNSTPKYNEKPKSVTPNVNPCNSRHVGDSFFIGYNYSSEMPLGYTIGILGFYASMNFPIFFNKTTSNSPDDSKSFTGETSIDGLEIVAGYSFKLIGGFLRLPIGIGMSMTEESRYFRDKYGNEGWYSSGNKDEKKFITEAGLQLILLRNFYLSATYRLIGFSKNGFTIGAGFIF